MFPTVRGEVQKLQQFLREGGCLLYEYPICFRPRLLLWRKCGLELGQPIPDVEGLQISRRSPRDAAHPSIGVPVAGAEIAPV